MELCHGSPLSTTLLPLIQLIHLIRYINIIVHINHIIVEFGEQL